MHQVASISAAILLSLSLAQAAVAAPDPVVVAQAETDGEVLLEEEIPAEDLEELDSAAPARSAAPAANNDIEEIVVQGGESEAAADLEAGDSVTGFDASDLEALGAQSVEDLAAFTPNLEIVTSGSTTPTFFIRGVGLNDFNANSSGAVAISVCVADVETTASSVSKPSHLSAAGRRTLFLPGARLRERYGAPTSHV